MTQLTLSGSFLGRKGDKETFEPQRSNAGIIYIPLIGGGEDELVGGEGGSGGVKVSEMPQYLALATESVRLPAVSTETMQLGYFNEYINIGGKQIVDDVDFVVKDFVDIPVAEYLERWFARVYNATNGAIGRASAFKQDVYILIYDSEGGSPRWYKLEGSFISRFARGDIDQNTSDIVRITVTLSVDRVIPNVSKGLGRIVTDLKIDDIF